MAATSFLTPTQRYAAAALFGLALHRAQTHQTQPLGFFDLNNQSEERISSSSSGSDSVSECPDLWAHEYSGLLRPVFKFLGIDSSAWSGLEETAGSGHPVGPFMRLLLEGDEDSSQSLDQELALSEAVDSMLNSMGKFSESSRSKREKHREYENQCREKYATPNVQSNSEDLDLQLETHQEIDTPLLDCTDPQQGSTNSIIEEKPVEEVTMLSYQRKVAVLYELLSACLSDLGEDNKKYPRRRKGYDARHRVALQLLATWLDIKWTKMEAIETMVACSAMAFLKEQESKKEETKSTESKWARWKRGGIIGAAAVTGGALMAITGGLAAPAIAAGLGALAPTLGTLVPIIGASGFAAAASAAGTVAGSVAVAASFGAAGAGLTGSKMARRVGSVDEFEFIAVGENHNQGRLAVEILVSGFVFEEDDFIRPWEGKQDFLERYVLQWESKNLIAVSTAIQDWLTSRLAMELMTRGAMMTVLSSLLTALAWPAALLSATDFIDSKWAIAIDRSDKAGKLLAEVLLSGLQGNR
ncbi:transmembrane and coiled-coil domain-containing protein 4-like isoform X1 [Senna tora]|uniref:Transmembrane and coiled-coil domain-containing protein 4-like isoform X1 n=1 Tax=Senna tora TaxID=362788 RepID=A0A834STW8_9FABA|nr:transmembrane and coiled-coil domain-containing protein 4-like isoform X1 [Senna tora]